jgi:serine O-acetyltransferase
MIKLINEDINAYTKNGNLLKKLKFSVLNHTIHMGILFRISHSIAKVPFIGKIFSKIFEYIIRIFYASDISYKASIEGGLVFSHGHDIVIGADVKIGKNCTIFNGVTLGNKNLEFSAEGNQPTIGNNVIISTGAKILGPVKIGNNVIIGANSVVIYDIPSNSIAVGAPAKVKKKIEN